MKRRGHNEGSVRKRKDGTWEVRYTAGGIRRSKYAKDEETAKKILKNIVSEINLGLYKEESNITVGEWLIEWLREYKKDSLKPSSYMRYDIIINAHILPKLGHYKLKDLTSGIVQKFLNEKYRYGYLRKDKTRKDKRLSPRSVEYIYVTLHSALKQAIKNNLIYHNVCDSVAIPAQEKKQVRVLSPHEQETLLNAIETHKNAIAFRIALMTGMRVGEIVALTWDDIDYEKGIITVNKNIVRAKTGTIKGKQSKLIVQKSPKTKSGFRTIPITPKLEYYLKLHSSLQIKHIKQNYVLMNSNFNPIDPLLLSKEFDKLLNKCNIENFTFHCLRHTFATRAMESGINPKVLQEILGHSSITMTLDLYSHVLDEHKKIEMDKLKNAF